MKIKVNSKSLLLFGMFLISSIVWNPVLAQSPQQTAISIKINTPADLARVVPSGDLTISGISSDDDTKNCQVYADWNDMKPMQNVTPSGPKGNADYSKWSFTYTGSYHNIVEGPNELTSKITCYDQGQNASSKFYSINVTGTKNGGKIANDTVQQSNENTDNEVTNISPVKDNNSNSTNDIVQQSNDKSDNSEDVVVTVVSSDGFEVKSQKDSEANDTVQQSNENTDNEVTNISPVKDNNSNSTNDIVQQSNENTDNEVTNISPVKDNNSKGKYKILPLYSGSDEEVANSVSSEDGDKTQVTSTDTSKSQGGDISVDMDDTNTKTLNSEPQEETQVTSTDTSKSQGGNTKTLSSGTQEETQVTSTDTSKSQGDDISVDTDDTNTKTLSSEQQEETIAYDKSKSQVAENTDEELSTDTNKYFTFEPDLQEETQVTSTDTGESQGGDISVDTDDTNTKTLSSEQQEETEETIAYDKSKSQVAENTDEELSTDTNKYFTFEPDLQEDEDLSENHNNPTINNADSDGSPDNHYKDGNSIFGLKIKDLKEDTKNKLENSQEKLNERLADSMQMFDLMR